MSTDKSPTAFFPDSKTAKNLANLSSEQRLLMLETLRQTEARDWINRYRKKIKEVGKAEALVWWHKNNCPTLEKRRGLKAEGRLTQETHE
jgi:hypothetical protein